MKKIYSLLAVSLLGIPGINAEVFSVGGLTYSVNDYTHATVVGCEDPEAKTITIPYTVNHDENGSQHMFFVTKVAENALAGSKAEELVLEAPPYEGAGSQGALVIEEGAFATSTLMKIVIDRPDLPEVTGNPFSAETLTEGSLEFGPNITEAKKAEYLATSPWSKFGKSVVTGLTETGLGPDAPAEIYSLAGQRIRTSTPAPGIYIVRRGNETVKVRF